MSAKLYFRVRLTYEEINFIINELRSSHHNGAELPEYKQIPEKLMMVLVRQKGESPISRRATR